MAKILIVEDDPLTSRALVRTLRRHECTCARNGVEALVLLEGGETFDLIISDVDMPYMSGIKLLQELNREYPSLPVVFHTGSSSLESLERLKVPIIHKDLVTPSEFLARIEDALGVESGGVVLPFPRASST